MSSIHGNKAIKKFSVHIDSLLEMLSFIEGHAQQFTVSSDHLNKIRLSCDEALTNIIKYSGLPEESSIEIHCSHMHQHEFTIAIHDQGVPFNPLTFQKAEHIELGGAWDFIDTHVDGYHSL